MNVTNVSICATEAAKAAGRPALTPELLAASGARYSRNNEGLQAILSKIDPNNQDKSVDSIFKMIDYGHQSIADLVPVSMFLDDISILQAYLIWSWCPTAGGQESSTRYIKLDKDGLVDPNLFGIAPAEHDQWANFMFECFEAYHKALAFWEQQVTENPDLARIPAAVLADTSPKGLLQIARMKRNYAFDRSRYFLPVAALTNMMMVMSARGWVQLCQNLLSHWLPECNILGEKIKAELALSAPRLIKHAVYTPSFRIGHLKELRQWACPKPVPEYGQSPCIADLGIFRPHSVYETELVNALSEHDNRYAFIGSNVARTSVRFSWSAVSMAEIRDFNRHRTGTKFCPLYPVGFYAAADQRPAGTTIDQNLIDLGNTSLRETRARLCRGDASFAGWMLLGHQFYFEHTTTLDKFVYEAELRTGPGAHYRYAKHIRDTVALMAKEWPDLAASIKLGESEPE